MSEPALRASGSNIQKLKSEAVAASIAEQALRLFDEQGFDRTTIDEIAASSGISTRSFFRYFRTKEEVVVGGHAAFGPRITEALSKRPENEGAWLALRRALDVLADNVASDPASAARTMRVVNSTASLRAHSLEKHLMWAADLTPEISRRLAIADSDDITARTLVHAALACLGVALAKFAEDESASIHALIDHAFKAVADAA